jgi:mono/diheme cytochrome c family protein
MFGGRGLSAATLALFLLAALPPAVMWHRSGSADEAVTDPFLGQPAAIAAGKQTYSSICYVCHHSAGGRGPNLFATKLSDERFLDTVINGRKGTQMPAFGLRLTPDEVWQVHAFVKSTDHYAN